MPVRPFGILLACMIVASCASDAPKADGPGASGVPEVASLRIDPPDAVASATLGAPPATMAFRALATTAGGAVTDVTAQATWVTDGAHVADVTGPGTLVTVGIGGHANVTATFGGASAAATLAVKLGGELSFDGAEPALFLPGSASPAVTQYPPDGVVVPANLPPLVLQWDAGGATTSRVHLTSRDVVDIMAYTTEAELALPSDAWSAIGASAPDAPITWAVETAGSSAPSTPRTMTITAERLGQGGLYAHDCKNGGLVVLDMLAGTQSPLATSSQANAPAEQRIGHCAGCHDVSRDGRRAGFGTLESPDGGIFFGTLRYDPSASLFAEAIAPDQIDARSAAFNPVESTTHAAMLAAYSIAAQSTSGIALLDPDTGLSLASDISSMFGAVPAAAGRGASTPAWSSHGDEIAFAAWPNDASPASQPQAPSNGSLVTSSVAYDTTAASFHFGPPKVLVAAENGESNLRPSYDDDDIAIAFMRTNPAALGSVLLYRRADGRVLTLAAGATDPAGAWDTRLPNWGPASGPKYTWMVAVSARPYGHLINPAQSQLWAFAIDRQKLASGTADPSAPAFWVPGQHRDQSYTHPQWPRAMLAR